MKSEKEKQYIEHQYDAYKDKEYEAITHWMPIPNPEL